MMRWFVALGLSVIAALAATFMLIGAGIDLGFAQTFGGYVGGSVYVASYFLWWR